MTYSTEYENKAIKFIESCESNTLLMEKIDSGSIEKWSDEDMKILEEFLESGMYPEILDYGMSLLQSRELHEELLGA